MNLPCQSRYSGKQMASASSSTPSTRYDLNYSAEGVGMLSPPKNYLPTVTGQVPPSLPLSHYLPMTK